jgi:DNA topoisomerase-1
LPDQHCPLCQKGEVVVKNTRWGKPFYGCSLYPACDFASWKQPTKDYRLTAAEWAEIKQKREEWKAKMSARKGASQAKNGSATQSKSAAKATGKKTTSKKATSKKVASKKAVVPRKRATTSKPNRQKTAKSKQQT